MATDGFDTGTDDLIAIGMKVVEMADRLRVMDAACPGAKASWGFEMDGQRFELSCSIKPGSDRSPAVGKA